MKIRTGLFLYILILFSFSKLWIICPWLFTWWVFPGSSAGKESACNDMGLPSGSTVKNIPAMQETQRMWVWSLGWEVPLEEEMATCSVFLPEKSHEQRSLVGYSLWDHKGSDTTEHKVYVKYKLEGEKEYMFYLCSLKSKKPEPYRSVP